MEHEAQRSMVQPGTYRDKDLQADSTPCVGTVVCERHPPRNAARHSSRLAFLAARIESSHGAWLQHMLDSTNNIPPPPKKKRTEITRRQQLLGVNSKTMMGQTV